MNKQESVDYLLIDGEYWLSGAQAMKYLSDKAGRNLDASYLNNQVRRGKLNPRYLGGRQNLYRLAELERIHVRSGPGRPGDVTLSEEAKQAISEGQRRRWQRQRSEDGGDGPTR